MSNIKQVKVSNTTYDLAASNLLITSNTDKAYLVGVGTAPTSTHQEVDVFANANVYLKTNGSICVAGGGYEHTLSSNSLNISSTYFDAMHLGTDGVQFTQNGAGWAQYTYSGISHYDYTDTYSYAFPTQSGTFALKETINEVPACSTSDNGKFLRVVSGVAAWAIVPSAEDNAF